MENAPRGNDPGEGEASLSKTKNTQPPAGTKNVGERLPHAFILTLRLRRKRISGRDDRRELRRKLDSDQLERQRLERVGVAEQRVDRKLFLPGFRGRPQFDFWFPDQWVLLLPNPFRFEQHLRVRRRLRSGRGLFFHQSRCFPRYVSPIHDQKLVQLLPLNDTFFPRAFLGRQWENKIQRSASFLTRCFYWICLMDLMV